MLVTQLLQCNQEFMEWFYSVKLPAYHHLEIHSNEEKWNILKSKRKRSWTELRKS